MYTIPLTNHGAGTTVTSSRLYLFKFCTLSRARIGAAVALIEGHDPESTRHFGYGRK